MVGRYVVVVRVEKAVLEKSEGKAEYVQMWFQSRLVGCWLSGGEAGEWLWEGGMVVVRVVLYNTSSAGETEGSDGKK